MYYPRSKLYRIIVILAGAVALLLAIRNPHPPLDWRVVGIFALLSLGVKRVGFRVAAEITHSLVNVVDVAALLLQGPVGGTVVALVSTVLHVQISLYRRGNRNWRDLLDLPLFDGGVKVLTALVSGTLYVQLGGQLAPTEFRLNQFLPLTVLYLSWFVLDHFFWIVLVWIGEGRNFAVAFVRRIWRSSLLIEGAPLPMSLPFAVAWTLFDPLLRGVTLFAMFMVAWLVRAFTHAVARSENRVKAVSILNRFGQSLAQGQPDEDAIAQLLYQYAGRILPEATFELVLLEADGSSRYLPQIPNQTSAVVPLIDYIVPLLRERFNARLLGDLSRTAIAVESQRGASERPTSGGAVVMPLISGEQLLGLFVAKSRRPYGLTLDDGRSLSILVTQATIALQNSRQFRQEERRLRQLATIAEVSRLVASVITLDNLLWQVADLIQANFGYYHVQIYLLDHEANEVIYRAGSGEAGRSKATQAQLTLKVGQEGVIGWVAGTGTPLLVPDVSREPRYIHRYPYALPDVRSELAVPLKIEDRVLGVLDVQSNIINDVGDEDLFTLTTLSDQLAIAIEEAQLYVAQRETAWVTTGLLQVAESLNPLYELDTIVERVARITPPLVGVEGAILYLWYTGPQHFTKGAASGLSPDIATPLEGLALLANQVPLLMEMRQRTQALLIPREAQQEPGLGPLGKVLGTKGVVLAPMLSQGEFIGVLVVVTATAPSRLSDRRQTLLAGISQQAAVAIQAAELHQDQQEAAMITRDLLNVAEMIASRNDLSDEILELVTRLTVTLAGSVNRCVIYVWDETKEQLNPRAAFGFPPEVEEAWKSTVLKAQDIPAIAVLYDSPEPVPLSGQGKKGTPQMLCQLFEADELVGIPLRARDTFFGIVVVDAVGSSRHIPTRLRAILMGMARQLSVAIENQRLYEDAIQNERRTQELILARQVQGALLPERNPELEGYDIAGYWRPAREVGGDFYDFVWLSGGRLAFSIADVADKGMAAALFMVLTRTALRESLWNEEEAGRAMSRTNNLIAADARGGMFLTTFLAILSPKEGVLQAANAGHLPPLIYRAAQESMFSVIKRSIPMAIVANMQYESFKVALEPGDFMVLFTDGMSDVTSPTGELFGLRRISELVYEHRDADANTLVEIMRDAAISHAQGEALGDDLTLVVVRRKPLQWQVETEN